MWRVNKADGEADVLHSAANDLCLSFELADILHDVVAVVSAEIIQDGRNNEGFFIIFVNIFQQSIL